MYIYVYIYMYIESYYICEWRGLSQDSYFLDLSDRGSTNLVGSRPQSASSRMGMGQDVENKPRFIRLGGNPQISPNNDNH